jgi:Fe-S cluster biogenesis protein NfuA
MFLSSSEMAIYEAPSKEESPDRTEVEQRILALLDNEIRPAIAQDGGDLEYHGFEDGVVRIKLIGACGTCPSSTMTLKHGIQNLLTEEIPEVLVVESV